MESFTSEAIYHNRRHAVGMRLCVGGESWSFPLVLAMYALFMGGSIVAIVCI